MVLSSNGPVKKAGGEAKMVLPEIVLPKRERRGENSLVE